MKKALVSVMILLTIVSCGGNRVVGNLGRRIVSSRPEKEMTLSPEYSISGPCLEATWGVHCVADSVIILQLRDLTGYCFRALNLESRTYQDFLLVGRGPDEVLAGFYSDKRKENGHTLLDITAINEGLLLSIDLEETLLTGQTKFYSKKEIMPLATISFPIGDKILSEVINDNDIYSYKLYSQEDQSESWKLQPFGTEEYLALYQPLFSSCMKIKPDGKKLSLSMLFFNGINIIDIGGDNHIGVSTSKKNDDSSIVRKAVKNKRLGDRYYYMQHDVTDDNIYALYYDCAPSESNGRTSSMIHVFSWDGELKAVYHLDEPLISITVSDDGKTLYGLTAEETLFVYKME